MEKSGKASEAIKWSVFENQQGIYDSAVETAKDRLREGLRRSKQKTLTEGKILGRNMKAENEEVARTALSDIYRGYWHLKIRVCT